MSLPKVVLGGGLVASLLAAPPAEARFGKRSDSTESSKPVHEATAIGSDRDGDSKKDDENKNRSSKSKRTTVASTDDDYAFSSSASDDAAAVVLGALFELLFSGLGHAIAETGTHHGRNENISGVPPTRESMRHAVPLSFRLGVLAAPADRGLAMDFSLGWDAQRFGADLRLTHLTGMTDDGTSVTGRNLSTMHVTFSPVVREEVRLRAEAGVSLLNMPGRTYVGPSLGLSVEACVLGPLDAEARVQVTPFPYQQVDMRAGLALHLGSLMLRGGARSLLLDSQVRPVGPSRDFGPEFGMGLTF
ncbi:hypothetical protein D7Y27_26990 [Corallococcus sp. AB004]|nr:hypothetical protein D7Y27_26990 [Corallococcus sp. AB004]